MSTSNHEQSGQVRLSLEALSKAVREMTPVGARVIPACPSRMNLLSRPYKTACPVCHYPGHQCDNIRKASSCRVAVMSTIGFWEDIVVHVAFLYSSHVPFHDAINNNAPSYDMRLDSSPPLGQAFEEIFVNRLTRNYLKFQSHYAGIRPKAMVILNERDLERYELITQQLNEFLLKSYTLSELFERSLGGAQ